MSFYTGLLLMFSRGARAFDLNRALHTRVCKLSSVHSVCVFVGARECVVMVVLAGCVQYDVLFDARTRRCSLWRALLQSGRCTRV
jgi:hypothetical protein